VLTPLVVVTMVGSLYFFNWQGFMTGRALIAGLNSAPAASVAAFEQAASYDTLGRQEVAEQTVHTATQFVRRQDIDIEVKQEIFSLAEREIQQEISRAPNDARLRLFLGSLYDQYGLFEQAGESFEKALELSPEKQRIWYQLAFNRLNLKQYDEAQELLRRAYELEESSNTSKIYYALGSYYAGDIELGDSLLEQVSNKGAIIHERLLVNAFAELGLYDRLLFIWQARVAESPNDPQARLSLAATYLKIGAGEQAIFEIERVMELDPNFSAQGQFLIDEIRAGRNPVQ